MLHTIVDDVSYSLGNIESKIILSENLYVLIDEVAYLI